MSEPFDLIISEATIVAPDAKKAGALVTEVADVGILNGQIAAIGSLGSASSAERISARGLTLLPGAIDTQVHFREPGFPNKEDLQSGSRAAVMGGVTTFFEMPNTQPATLSAEAIKDKLDRAANRSWANYAFYMGASPVNVEHLNELQDLPHVCGVKIFMGSSTGNLIVGSDENLEKAVRQMHRKFAVHAEDEDRLKERKHIVEDSPGKVELHPVWRDVETALMATKKIVGLARKHGKKVHVLHVTSGEEAEFLSQNLDVATFEITPQHLTLSAPECYSRLGTLAQMNPPIREKRHTDRLWKAIQDGSATVIGSDHAPHTLAEKMGTYPQTPSGMTGVQTLLPLMIHHMNQKRLSLHRLVELTSMNASRIFGIRKRGAIAIGNFADLSLVDLQITKTISNSWIQSRCGWSPFDGMKIQGWVNATVVSGTLSMRDGEFIGQARGQAVDFNLA